MVFRSKRDQNFLHANKNPPSQISVSAPEYINAITYDLTQVMLSNSNEDLNIFVRTFRLGKPLLAVQLRDNVQNS